MRPWPWRTVLAAWLLWTAGEVIPPAKPEWKIIGAYERQVACEASLEERYRSVNLWICLPVGADPDKLHPGPDGLKSKHSL
jgi:hypothetical protein